MMRLDINYYAILGISSTASPELITQAFRKRILEVHLDKQIEIDKDSKDLCYTTIEAHRVLSDRNLRAKYDIQFSSNHKDDQPFIPAGYICYDVGEEGQLSKRILQTIDDWKKEFVEIQGDGISDNYFEYFSTLMGQVLDPEISSGSNSGNQTPTQESSSSSSYFCAICDKRFPTPAVHWEQVLFPYVNMFSCDQSGVRHLFVYFESILGQELFNWEPRYLPSRLLGIWGSEEWSKLTKYDQIINKILNAIPPEDYFQNVKEQVAYVHETFLSDSETDEEEFPPQACKVLCWVLVHQNKQMDVVNKVNDLLEVDDVMEIMYIASVMKSYLECAEEEWTELMDEALNDDLPELAMLWAKIGIGFGELVEFRWYELGMRIHEDDPTLAHFCFIMAGYESDEDWEVLADAFSRKRDHLSALEYHNMKKSGQSCILQKSTSLLKIDPNGATTYRSVHFSSRIKSILRKLQQRRTALDTYTFDQEIIEELVYLVTEITDEPIEGFKIISNTWPESFDEKPFQGVHRAIMEAQLKKRVNSKTLDIIIASMHYLPFSDDNEELLKTECVKLAARHIEQSINSSDFKALGEILHYMTKRFIPGAKQVLEQMELAEHREAETKTEGETPTTIKPSPHLKSMKNLINGTINKLQQNWLGAMTDYQNALLCNPECMHRIIPCITKLCHDIEFHEAVVGQVQSEVKDLKSLFDAEEYPKVETYGVNRSSSLIISDVAPKDNSRYKDSMSKIGPDPDKIPEIPALPPEEPHPLETNTPMVTLDKNQEAIEVGQGGPLAELNAALAYIDLLKALPLSFQPGPIVMAASHFLKAMDDCDDPGSLFAYRNAIILMAENLLQIDRKTQAVIQHCLTHKQMLSILLSAHEKLSKILSGVVSDEEKDDSSTSESEDELSESESSKEIESSGCESSKAEKETISVTSPKPDLQGQEVVIISKPSQESTTKTKFNRKPDKKLKSNNKSVITSKSDEESAKSSEETNNSSRSQFEVEDDSSVSSIEYSIESELSKPESFSRNKNDSLTRRELPKRTLTIPNFSRNLEAKLINDEKSLTISNTKPIKTQISTLENDVSSSSDSEKVKQPSKLSKIPQRSASLREPKRSPSQLLPQRSSSMRLPKRSPSQPTPKRSPSGPIRSSSSKTELISKSEAGVISKFLKNVVNFPKLDPLANIPTLSCSDLVYVESMGNSFLSQFCSEKVDQDQKYKKSQKHLHAYTHFVEVWKGRSLLTDFKTARVQAMEELLSLKKWDLADVEKLMHFSILDLTDEGWSSEYRTPLHFLNPSQAYRSIHGFKIESDKISFILTKDNRTGNLFDSSDIFEIFSNGIEESILTLDCPDLMMRSHPFRKANFDHLHTKVPNYFQTISRVAMLLCYFSSGFEICSKAPFHMRTTGEGLLNRLDEHLQHLLRPTSGRKEKDPEGGNPDLDIQHRFWFHLTEVFEEEEEDETKASFIYKVGEVTAKVNTNTLITTLDGIETKAKMNPEAEFARDFTQYFDEIGKCFPELFRLKELAKISVICTKLKKILAANILQMKQNGRSKKELIKIKNICESIEEMGIFISEEDKLLYGKNSLVKTESQILSNCTWFPATCCNNMESEIYDVTAGVIMTPQVTYGPVDVPRDCVSISTKNLFWSNSNAGKVSSTGVTVTNNKKADS